MGMASKTSSMVCDYNISDFKKVKGGMASHYSLG